MKTPIQIGTYRLRNGRKACIVQVNAASAVGTIEDTGDTLRWNSETGFFGYLEPGPWDLVERIDTPNESALTILRREHAAMMTIADSHAAISNQALASAQEIEHRIVELERSGT